MTNKRVQFRAGCKPAYLAGVEATVLHKQPGEPRYLVRVDKDPRARKYAGGEWCVHETHLTGIDIQHIDSTFRLLNTEIETRALGAAGFWRKEIAEIASEAADEWRATVGQTIPEDLWDSIYKPALLWRFLFNLAKELETMAGGWEELFYQEMHERIETGR